MTSDNDLDQNAQKFSALCSETGALLPECPLWVRHQYPLYPESGHQSACNRNVRYGPQADM